ncbi:GNAT family N-acetyltransferase [Bacillus benzoevorans]|uniref:GNAT superfamily N-acetyltransferase n=1 Tax=Bacillus benzoevorans TaxID=1456 RepID=A0A7X0LU08_9BACI|nr:GNAT superfamily N-acetyltransferase [Bacillus benzoevorans]
MDFLTVDHWDEDIWQKWKEIYLEAFGGKNAKPEKVLRNMFRKQMSSFHLAEDQGRVYAIALSGKLEGTTSLVIDYLAVKKNARKQGIGVQMVDYLKRWAKDNHHFDSIVIEVEAEETEENTERVEFWKQCGFQDTSYVHHYKVVPEPYQAMYLKLVPEAFIPEKAETIFQHFSQFHQKCFRGA